MKAMETKDFVPFKYETGDMLGLLYLGRPLRVLIGFNSPFSPPFSSTLLNFEEYRGRIRNRIKFWIERLIIDLPREFGFRGTWF